jgi:hypothetical protein
MAGTNIGIGVVKSVFATAAFFHGRLDVLLGLPGALLDAAQQFIFFPFREPEIIIRKLRKFLLQFAFGDIPISFGDQSAHTNVF